MLYLRIPPCIQLDALSECTPEVDDMAVISLKSPWPEPQFDTSLSGLGAEIWTLDCPFVIVC